MENGISIKALFQGLAVKIQGDQETEITGICAHSKFVTPGNLFIAKKGACFDGTEFISDAIASGALAILTHLYHPFLAGVVQIIYENPKLLEAEIARRFFKDPSKELFLIGITGTNGKTTTAYLTYHLLNKRDHLCGLMGTIETLVGSDRMPAQLTTADLVTNQKFLRKMCNRGAKNAVMEVTSHALDQGRINGIDFDLGIFTNLSQDHLDYHGTIEHYLQAKAKLFQFINSPEKTAILNADDPRSFQVFGNSAAQVVTYGIDHVADFRAKDIQCSLEGTCFTLSCKGQQDMRITTPLIGCFNILNILAAIASCYQRDMTLEYMQDKLNSFPGVPGRLERIANSQGIYLFVDFAHTDQALEHVLSTLTLLKQKKIITIFGCGGERDSKKRPKMAEVAERFSDLLIITSDNPRMEEPLAICHEIATGITQKERVHLEVNRKRAIEQGIAWAKRGDIVLIAGRGHEPFQKIGGQLLPFNDREVAEKICNYSS